MGCVVAAEETKRLRYGRNILDTFLLPFSFSLGANTYKGPRACVLVGHQLLGMEKKRSAFPVFKTLLHRLLPIRGQARSLDSPHRHGGTAAPPPPPATARTATPPVHQPTSTSASASACLLAPPLCFTSVACLLWTDYNLVARQLVLHVGVDWCVLLLDSSMAQNHKGLIVIIGIRPYLICARPAVAVALACLLLPWLACCWCMMSVSDISHLHWSNLVKLAVCSSLWTTGGGVDGGRKLMEARLQ